MKVGAVDVEICSKLRLVISQVKGDFEARDLRILDFLKIVYSLQAHFGSEKVTQISRGQNSHVDFLAILASSVGGSIPRIISVKSLESLSINHQEHCQVAAVVVSPS